MIIGLTGGIASGKSTVARLFKKKGALVLDADKIKIVFNSEWFEKIAHRVIEPAGKAYQKIVSYFGPAILNRDHRINRHRLANIVFFSPAKLKKLNSFIHPEVIKIIRTEAKKWQEKRVIVIDAPLLIETGLHKEADRVVVVICPVHIQIKRLRKRNRISKREAMMRIRQQMPLRDKVKSADEVIDGELSLKNLRKRVEQIWEKSFSL